MTKGTFTLGALLIFSTWALAQPTNNSCVLLPESKRCVDATPCKVIDGVAICLAGTKPPSGGAAIPQSCWQYAYDFACTSDEVNTCSQYENNKACSVIKSNCVDTIPETGRCSSYANTYTCQTKDQVTEQKLECASGVFNSNSLVAPQNTNTTFNKAAVAQEILRQSTTYGNEGKGIFEGVVETCRKGYYGIKNCCKPSGGATANSTMMNVTLSGAYSAVKYAGQVAVDAASPYVFDAMYTGGQYMSGLASNFSSSAASSVADFTSTIPDSTSFSAGGPSLSAYGFTYQSGVAAQGSGFLGANTTIATFGEGSSMTSVSFNPYVFGALVAIQVVQSLKSCTQDEQMLAMHLGANLSFFLKEECSKKILGSCVQWTSSYCSFNSVLARLINTQGKPQLGMNVNDCKGFTVDQISKLDFTKIDLSEFTSQMTNQAVKNTPTNIQGNYTPIMQRQTSGTSQGSSANLPSYAP